MGQGSTKSEEIEQIKRRLSTLNVERERLEAELKKLVTEAEAKPDPLAAKAQFSNTDKIKIFRSLFRGREDVFPVRWENTKSGKSGYAIACGNEWVRGICGKPRIKCSACENKAFLLVTDEVIRFHLSGKDNRNKSFCAGVYPMLLDESCWFLAADFDKETWREDIAAFLKTCNEDGIPAYVERSRSGNGGHAWIFFHEAVPASDARKLGTTLLTKTMEHHPELGFASYDRLFPSQDTLPIYRANQVTVFSSMVISNHIPINGNIWHRLND